MMAGVYQLLEVVLEMDAFNSQYMVLPYNENTANVSSEGSKSWLPRNGKL